MRELLVMTVADLRMRVRDRTVLIFGLLVPLGLIVVFHSVLGGNEDIELEPVTVVAGVPTGDRLGATLVDALGSLEVLDVTVEQVSASEARASVRAEEADLALLVPPGFTRDLQAGVPVTVRLIDAQAGLETDVLTSVVDGTVDQMHAVAQAARAGGASGMSRRQVGQIVRQVSASTPTIELSEGEAADEQLSAAGALVAGQAGLFLLFTVGFGVLALLAEREQGTLARLHSMPIRPGLVIAAKGVSGFVLGVMATTVLLVTGGLLFGVDFGQPVAVAVLILCAVAAATSLTFVVARLARTAEQANVSQAILAMALGVAGGAFLPVTARGALGQVLDLNPVAAFQRGLGITSGGGGVADIWVPVLIMLGFAAACVLLSRLLPDRGAGL
jgi:ABC-2 type transport system permease protein